jgi:hypothetical protein
MFDVEKSTFNSFANSTLELFLMHMTHGNQILSRLGDIVLCSHIFYLLYRSEAAFN